MWFCTMLSVDTTSPTLNYCNQTWIRIPSPYKTQWIKSIALLHFIPIFFFTRCTCVCVYSVYDFVSVLFCHLSRWEVAFHFMLKIYAKRNYVYIYVIHGNFCTYLNWNLTIVAFWLFLLLFLYLFTVFGWHKRMQYSFWYREKDMFCIPFTFFSLTFCSLSYRSFYFFLFRGFL